MIVQTIISSSNSNSKGILNAFGPVTSHLRGMGGVPMGTTLKDSD